MNKAEESIRLNKYLAVQLGISRREADDLIEKGRVTINGTPAILGSRISATDAITVNNKPLKNRVEYLYLALHKPVGYICSRRRQGDTPTIYELLPPKYHALKPVGRLDKDSSGLILLTNDGDFAFQMTHPSFHKMKIYEVGLDRDLEPLHQQMISDHGIQLEDGRSQFQLEHLQDSTRDEWRIHMTEGRNRQIRRTFAALGYIVVRLHRTQFGAYTLDTLRSGEYRLFLHK
jgi:23S rRNA pseudouridine2605 synthase